MKVALINPAPILDEKEHFYGQSWPPLGILLLGTLLKNDGHAVKILDQASNRFSFENTLKWIKHFNPDVVGISAMTVAFQSAITLSKLIKNWNSNIIIVLGHYHPTICASEILEKYGDIIDFCVRGENEYILTKLIDKLEKKFPNSYDDILGLSFCSKGKIVHTPDCPVTKNLDELPLIDRSFINIPYRMNLAGIDFINSKFTSAFFTRGCPFGCSYCAVSRFSGRQYRSKSPERMVEEFLYLYSQGYTEVAFVDDNFSFNLNNVKHFCNLLKKEKLNMNWHIEMRVDNVSRQLFQLLASAGCKSINFGIESANPRILKYYNKKITPEQSLRAIKTAKESKIDFVIGLFMIGAPFETISECKNTIQFAQNCGVDFFFLNIVETWPGIPMWDDLVSKNLINPKERWETTTRVIDLTHTEAQRKIILELIKRTYKEFISPKRFAWLLKSLPDFLLSPYKRKVGLDFVKHLGTGMKAMVRVRNLKLSGFGKFTTED